jgi:DNA-binding transcriptional LysR family regulator
MLEDFRLKIFLTVAQEGGFTKAAAALGVTQPSVSQNVAELEKKLGTKLFERLRSDVVLTPAGRIFKEYAERIQAEYDETLRVLARFPDTVVRILASEEVFDYLVSDLLADFLLAHPELSFERAFIGDYDLKITLVPDNEKRGMFALSYHPSSYFAATRLWRVLSQCF